jgi:tetratricopeptide (TPR) repeat protein
LLDAAVQDCTRAIELQPDYAKAWYRRGRIQADLRNYENAIDDMKKVLSLESSVGGQKQVKQQMADLEILMSEMTVMDEASHMIPAVDSRKQKMGTKNNGISHGYLLNLDARETVGTVYRTEP